MDRVTMLLTLLESASSCTPFLAVSTSHVPALALLVGGSAVCIGFSFSIRQGMRSRTWLPVSAVVVEHDVSPSTSGDSDAWVARIRYSYIIENVRYESTRRTIPPDLGFRTEAGATEAIGSLRAGDRCTVYVDPARLNYAVLEPGPQLSHVVATIVGAAIVGVGALVACGVLTI